MASLLLICDVRRCTTAGRPESELVGRVHWWLGGCNVVGLRRFERVLQGIWSSLCFRVLESGAAEPFLTACEREEGFSAGGLDL